MCCDLVLSAVKLEGLVQDDHTREVFKRVNRGTVTALSFHLQTPLQLEDLEIFMVHASKLLVKGDRALSGDHDEVIHQGVE